MKRLRNAPSGATKRARVPTPDRAPSSPHPDEGPAPQVAGVPVPVPVPVPDPTPAAAQPEPQGSTPSPFFPASFNFTDPTHARAWIGAVREAAEDLAALAREGGRRIRHRVLARHEILRQTRKAARSLNGLLMEAEAVLAPPERAP